MKKALSSFDVQAVVRELQAYLDWRIDKVYQPSGRRLVISIKAPRKDREFLHFRVGEWLYVSRNAHDMPHRPSDFAMMLRKRITNCRIASVEQQGFDRIVIITLEKEDRYQLVFELFSKGNVILVKDGVIVQPLTSRAWRHREVKARRKFEFPPPVRDPATMSRDELWRVLNSSDSDVVRTLATKLNLGGAYSEEACERANVARSRPADDISPDESERLLGAMNAVAEDIRTEQRGYIITKNGQPVDAVPLRMAVYDDYEQEQFDRFTDCIEKYVSRIPKQRVSVEESPGRGEFERLERKLAQQERAMLTLQEEALEAQATGDSMFAAYGDIAHILMTAKDHLTQSKDLDDLPGFVSFNRRSALLTIEVDGKIYDLDVNGTVESNAQKCYEKGKKLKGKLEGVLPALEETRATMAQWRQNQRASLESQNEGGGAPTKRFWFERYRWFISSEGAIVIGGKDARTNDMLVKKHLKPGDRYVHADIHGAPSVVVKMAENIGSKTLMEACEFSVATSKAWNAKIGSGVGYWVLPEQVSKTPQSGEFLARGAFVIRGKRNYSPKAAIRLGLGEITHEGERKVMCGPVGAIEARSRRYAVIIPGTVDKNAFAKAAAKAFEVPIEEIQRVLPPGNLDIQTAMGVEIQLNAS